MSRPAPLLFARLALVSALLLSVSCSREARLTEQSAGDTKAPKPTAPTSATTTTVAAAEGAAGAAGAGDEYFPERGNGGYDIERYTVALAYDPAQNELDGTVTIDATVTSTEALRSIDLDLHGMEVAAVKVDGEAAVVRREGDELIVEPATVLEPDDDTSIEVQYSGVPEPVSNNLLGTIGWIDTAPGSFVANEPIGAASWLPGSDHPSDKAAFTFRITVPEGLEVVANGTLVGATPGPTGVTWEWRADQPMATYLATVTIGEYEFREGRSAAGVPIRHAFPPSVADLAEIDFSRTGEMLDFLAERFGPYPFSEYGALLIDADFGFALETQTRPLFPAGIANGLRSNEIVALHEMSHQWFGDSVTPAQWDDVWLNEGFATYAEWLWLERDRGVPLAQSADLEVADMASRGPLYGPPPGTPTADGLFAPSIYGRGALTLEAVRRTVGNDPFFATLRAWATERRHGNGSTEDFVETAERVTGTQLDEVFNAWLFDDTAPALPPAPA